MTMCVSQGAPKGRLSNHPDLVGILLILHENLDHDQCVIGVGKIPILITGNPGSVIVPQYGSSKITVFTWGKNIVLKFLGNTK